MATVVMPQLTSHRAIASKSSVNVENTRTGFSSRSGGTATKISLAPISIPPAFGSKSGRSSRHIPFRLRPRLLLLALPLLAWAFSSADFGGCFFGLDIHLILSAQATAKSRKGKHSFNRNQPGMLPQTVTTVWRTKLGTTLLIGFNNSTGLSAYFRYLGFSQSPPKRRITPSSSPVWPRGTRALASEKRERLTPNGSPGRGPLRRHFGTLFRRHRQFCRLSRRHQRHGLARAPYATIQN